ncbi:MAG: proton-conducting transporter membrane subunit, partial [Thermodesulfovibrionaceae bacterium]
MKTLDCIYISFVLMTLGVVLTSTIKNRSLSGLITFLFTAGASFALSYFSLNILVENKIVEKELFSLKPLLNSSLALKVDGLSALFLLIIAVVSLCVSMFSWKYLTKYRQPCQRFYPFLLALFMTSTGFVCVKDLFFFIVFWELMTLISWFLVIFDRENTNALKAGLQYFVVTHAATGFLILAAVVVYSISNTFDFSEVKESFYNLSYTNPLLTNFLVCCIFIAFITKAGVLPFGFWLPNTYPQPPAPASSFFGGVMSKLAVYAIFRFFCSLMPISSHTQLWGFIIAIVGSFSIFIGTTAALTQEEAKKLMSFHAIGQVGYILLGLGVGLYFININPFLSTVALIGGLLHLFNNSIYKSLLFLNAGSIFYKTYTTDLNKVSGLITLMPTVAMTALVGSLSIAGVPLFNGFVSKLLIFESSVWSARQTEAFFLVRGFFVVFGIISLFISAVTLASFLKFINSVFMGKLKEIYSSEKIHWSMNLSQLILALVCILVGIFPSIFLKLVYNAISSSLTTQLPSFRDVFFTDFSGINIFFC